MGDRQSPSKESDISQPDVLVVDWDGPDDPENPKNWPVRQKMAATIIVSLFTFISPVSSAMIAPASQTLAEEFGVTSTVVLQMMTSIFVLAYAIGPLFLGPLSEIYGRTRVLQFANLFYLVWNLVCAWAPNKSAFIAFRFFAGFGGSAPLAIGAGVLGDVWTAEQRGQAIAIYSLAPLLGPVIGPVSGAWIAERSNWRWVFWSTSIFTVVVQLAGLVFLQESYPPFLLERKAKQIKKSLDPEKNIKYVRTPYEGADRDWKTIFAKSMIRPFALFVREPIIQIIGLYMTLIYGVFYLFLTTITDIFVSIYNEPTGIAGLHYIPLGIGFTVMSQINARTMDRIYVYLRNTRGNGEGQPEFRVPAMVPGSIVFPIGLFLAGWATEKRLHWIAVDFGIGFVGGGMILSFQSMQAYVVDSFTLHAASAMAAVACMRALAGFAFPLFAPKMYQSLGYGWGDSLLAFVAIVLGCPAPFLFWKYGKSIRMKSRYAKKS